jgi:hypothetical protein
VISFGVWMTNIAFLIQGESGRLLLNLLYARNLIQTRLNSGIARVNDETILCPLVDLTLFTAPFYMATCARTLRSTRHRMQPTNHHRHPDYRHHVIAHHARWIAPPAPLWSRHFRSDTTLVETGGNLGGKQWLFIR